MGWTPVPLTSLTYPPLVDAVIVEPEDDFSIVRYAIDPNTTRITTPITMEVLVDNISGIFDMDIKHLPIIK
jgi:hypothetical protein